MVLRRILILRNTWTRLRSCPSEEGRSVPIMWRRLDLRVIMDDDYTVRTLFFAPHPHHPPITAHHSFIPSLPLRPFFGPCVGPCVGRRSLPREEFDWCFCLGGLCKL